MLLCNRFDNRKSKPLPLAARREASAGQLHPLRVRPGGSDGTVTAILDGELSENTPVVTGQAIAGTTPTTTTGSPFMPQRPARSPRSA